MGQQPFSAVISQQTPPKPETRASGTSQPVANAQLKSKAQQGGAKKADHASEHVQKNTTKKANDVVDETQKRSMKKTEGSVKSRNSESSSAGSDAAFVGEWDTLGPLRSDLPNMKSSAGPSMKNSDEKNLDLKNATQDLLLFLRELTQQHEQQ